MLHEVFFIIVLRRAGHRAAGGAAAARGRHSARPGSRTIPAAPRPPILLLLRLGLPGAFRHRHPQEQPSHGQDVSPWVEKNVQTDHGGNTNYMKNDEFKPASWMTCKSAAFRARSRRPCEILLDKKAEKITVLKLKGISEMTDYLVICSGNSTRQNKALADAVRENLKKDLQLQPLGMRRRGGGGMDPGRLRRFHRQHLFRRLAEEVCPGKAVDGCQTIRFLP